MEENRLVVSWGRGLEEGWSRRLGLADVSFHIWMDKQGSTIEHREIYSISNDEPQWKRMF